jgi:hypothetical protein
VNPLDVMKYGNQTLMRTLEGVPDNRWTGTGICGYWTVKNVIAHLASHELVLTDVLNGFLGGGPTSMLDKYRTDRDFNDSEVNLRASKTPAETLAEYQEAYACNAELAAKISPEKWREAGTLPWYGLEYSLEDYIVYGFYGHKREHSAQIAVFKDTLKPGK